MINKKKVLGRGLGALIGEASAERHVPAAASAVNEKFFFCATDDISPNKSQPRKHFEEKALSELCDSIKEKGIIEPLVVRRAPGGFELIAGERRWRASRMAGLAQVPVVVVEANEEESLELAIIENIQREGLNPVEEADSYRSLMAFGLSQGDVAKKVGKDRATVANYLRILKLPHEVREEIVKGNITMGHARALLSIEGHAAQAELCRQIITKGLSVREAEALSSAQGKSKTKQRPGETLKSPIEDELRGIFGTKVALKDRKGKGRVEISYFSVEERERILEMLRSVEG